MGEPASSAVCGGSLLGVFARYWQPGEVKTRLAQRIGDEPAARLHRQFVEATLTQLAGIARQQWLAISPAEAQPRIAAECASADGWRIVGQRGANLGERMGDFFTRALAVADGVVLVGADSPDLPLAYVEQALAALTRVPVVIGPADDGGYYLLGVSRAVTQWDYRALLFDKVPWGTNEVLAVTSARLTASRIEYHLLPTWYDVDNWEALQALRKRLVTGAPARDESLSALRAQVDRELDGLPSIVVH